MSGCEELVILFEELEAASSNEERDLKEERCRQALENQLRKATLLWRSSKVITKPVQTVLLQIRASFVKHPYDLIGRRLAASAKNLLMKVERGKIKSTPHLPCITPQTRKCMRLVSMVAGIWASLLLMLIDFGSDVWVIWDINSLRLGDNVGQGLVNAEALFNSTARRTLWDDFTKDVKENNMSDRTLINGICTLLKDNWIILDYDGRTENISSLSKWNLKHFAQECVLYDLNHNFSCNFRTLIKENSEKIALQIQDVHLKCLDVLMTKAFYLLNFSTRHLLTATYVYLLLILVKTLIMQALSIGNELWRHSNRPIFCDLRLMKILALGTNSSELMKEPAQLRATSLRNSLAVQEAVYETLATLKIQLYFLSVASSIEEGFKRFLSLCVPGENMQDALRLAFIDDIGIFSPSWRVSIWRSVLAGILSLTFAQYKLGVGTKHQTDASVCAKCIYLLACLLNTLSIIITESAYFFFAVATSFGILAIDWYRRCGINTYYLSGLYAQQDTGVIVIVMFAMNRIPTFFISLFARRPAEKLLFKTRLSCSRGDRGGYNIFGWGRPEFFWFLPAIQAEEVSKGAEEFPEHHFFQAGNNSRVLYR